MKVLLVHAHPEARSLNGSLKNLIVDRLTQAGHEVRVSDLYAMQWKAPLDAADFAHVEPGAHFDPVLDSQRAYEAGTQPADIAGEQAKLLWADAVIFQFPLWWYSMPAILKGWVDRVFSRGFAYSAGRKYETGHFRGKRAMLCLTTGTASTLYEANGIDGDLHHVLWPIHNGILAYTGFTVLPPFAAWMPARVSAPERESCLDALTERLRSLDRSEPLFFHPWSDYDDSQRLKPGVAARSGVQWNPRAGQTFAESASHFAQRHSL